MKKHTKFIQKILKLISHNKTRVIYIRGNHDDFLNSFIPFEVGDNFTICDNYVYESFGKKYLVIHGDIFDEITTKATWLSKFGDIGYEILLMINRYRNNKRSKKGLPYKSFSQEIKNKVKFLTNFLFKFEEKAINYTKQKECDGIICGHTHKAEIKIIKDVLYLNSGDWVESNTALLESIEGEWSIKTWFSH